MLETIIKVITVIIALLSTITAVIAIKQSAQLKNKDFIHADYEYIKEWFEKTLFIMKDLYLRHPDGKNKDELEQKLVKLSTNIDMGRVFFKNQIKGDYKINKPAIFKGYRVLILDVLVLYFEIYSHNVQGKNQDILWCLQRAFINETVSFLNQNKNSKKFTPYTHIDENNVIDFKNINNEEFRKIVLSEDIIDAVKKHTISINK